MALVMVGAEIAVGLMLAALSGATEFIDRDKEVAQNGNLATTDGEDAHAAHEDRQRQTEQQAAVTSDDNPEFREMTADSPYHQSEREHHAEGHGARREQEQDGD